MAEEALDGNERRRLAQLVLDRELRQASAEAARDLVERSRPCASASTSALYDRAKVDDAAGALAAIVLYEADLAGPGVLVRQGHADPAWRAAEARGLVRASDGEERRRAISDPDERVRKQALRAAMHVGDVEDSAAVLEAARLDPSPSARESAIRAAGAIGGEDVVRRLRDLWADADEVDRRAIAEAWGMPRAFRAGGEGELVRVLETASGAASVVAAASLQRLSGEGESAGLHLLSRSIREGSARNRALAIRLAPLTSEAVRSSLREAANDPDPFVQIAALTRLVDSPTDRASSLDLLALLAEAGQHAAILALARAGDGRAIPDLVERMGSPDPRVRRTAAEALVDAGDEMSAAPLLGDDDASVRAAVACRLLTARD